MNLDFGLHINRKDVLTIVIISIVFFGIAAWNVGEIKYPVTNWQSTQPTSFYVSVGSIQYINEVYFFVQSGNASVTVSYGSPGNWTTVGTLILQPVGTDYSVFQDINVGENTEFLNFNVQPTLYDSRPDFYWSVPNPSDKPPSNFIEISEIGLQGQNNQEVPIISITGENTTDKSISKLVDEQGSLQIPPDYMSKMYFDEVYFARSAEEYLHLQIPLERTHPPLGKLIQASGIAIFGETPFGWRIMGVIFGTLMVPLMYLLSKKLFGTWIAGFSAAFLFSFDFMHFTMARIGTVDTYVVFFSLLSQLFFLVYFMNVIKDGWKTSILPLFLAVIFFALGFSTKWFTIFSAAGMLALLAIYRLNDVRKLKGTLGDKYIALFDYPVLPFVGFLGLTVVIYFSTYIPEMLAGDSFGTILNLQNAMASFQGGNVAASSTVPWWSWPLMIGSKTLQVPKWFDITYLPHNVVSTITAMGNPIVWWIGFACIIMLVVTVIVESEFAQNLWKRVSRQKLRTKVSSKERDLSAFYILVVYFFSWLPYIVISRATYIYHYYLSVPLLCLATTYFVNKIWNHRLGKIAAIALFASVVIMFIVFYPVISGMPVSADYVHKLKWLPGWFFAP